MLLMRKPGAVKTEMTRKAEEKKTRGYLHHIAWLNGKMAFKIGVFERKEFQAGVANSKLNVGSTSLAALRAGRDWDTIYSSIITKFFSVDRQT